MIVIGITGSIGMGKTTVASQFAALGAKVLSADAIVHALLSQMGEASREVARYFPEAAKDGMIDRNTLAEIVFTDENKLALLEQILHPLVVAEEERFIAEERGKGTKCVAIDIPLLYETGAEVRFDKIVVVTAPAFVQRKRVFARPHMSEEKLARILARQMADKEKRLRADAVINTGLGKAHSFRKVKKLMKEWT